MILLKANELELAVINDLLISKGKKTIDDSLKLISDRDFTGVGVFSWFIRDERVRVGYSNETYLHDEIFAYLDEDLDTGYLIRISDGYIDSLECHTMAGEPWPKNISKIKLYHL